MRHIAVALIVLSCLAGLTLSAPAESRGCSARPSVGSSISKTTISIPTFLEVLTLGAVDASVGITLHEGHSLNLGQVCDCRPACEKGKFQYTSVRSQGWTSAFGGDVEWTEQISGCEPGFDGGATTVSRVTTSGTYTSGQGTLRFSSIEISTKVGMKASKVAMAFSFDTECRCQDQPCPGSASYPRAFAVPDGLHLIHGETGKITISATDEDGDLQLECISHAQEAGGGSPLVVDPASGGGPGGASANATFFVTCRETEDLAATAGFTIWDEQGNSVSIQVPVKIWRGGPSIEIVESETGWEGDTYAVRFRLDDPDFADCDARAETVTWGVSNVSGGYTLDFSGLPWFSTETCWSQGELHGVIFVPTSESEDPRRFTIWAEDLAGHLAVLTVNVNRSPDLEATEIILETASDGASVSGAFDVSQKYSDADGDELVDIELVVDLEGRVAAHGAVTLEGTKITYVSDEGFGGKDSFGYRVKDECGEWSANETVTVRVLTPPVASSQSRLFHPVVDSDDRDWELNLAPLSLYASDLDAGAGSCDYSFLIDNAPSVAKLQAAGLFIEDEHLGGTASDACSGTLIRMSSDAQISGPISMLKDGVRIPFSFSVLDPDDSESVPASLAFVFTNGSPAAESSVQLPAISWRVGEPPFHFEEPDWTQKGCLSFSDPDGDPLTFSLGRSPRYGTANLLPSSGGGEYNVTVAYGIDRDEARKAHTGEKPYVARFSVIAEDPFGATAETNCTVTVDVLNTDPVCFPESATTVCGVPVDIAVLANDSDIDGDELTVVSVSGGSFGSSSISHKMIRYEPSGSFCGDDILSYTVSDGYGGKGSASVTVHVIDPDPPSFANAPGDIGPVANDPGACRATVTWSEPAIGVDVTDNVGIASLICSHVSGDVFPIGDTPVAYTATDTCGNEAEASFTISVEDQEPPVIEGMPSSISIEVDEGETGAMVSWALPTASDNCELASFTGSHTPGSTFPLDDTTVTYTAEDIYGNTSISSFTVSIVGPPVNRPPVAMSDSVSLGPNQIGTSIAVLANDYDPDGDDIELVSVGGCSPCGSTSTNGNSVTFFAEGCQPFLGDRVTSSYTIRDSQGAEDRGTIRIRLPSSGNMPEVAPPPEDDR